MSRMGVALVPAAEAVEDLVRLQAELRIGGLGGPRLSREGNVPHISLFQGDFDDGLSPDNVLGHVRDAFDGQLHVVCQEVVHYPENWLFLLCNRTETLDGMQQAVVRSVESHLSPEAIEDNRDLAVLSKLERASYRQYGYRYAGDAFLPHITLGRTTAERADELVTLASAHDIGKNHHGAMPIAWATVYAVGPYGAHADTIARIRL